MALFSTTHIGVDHKTFCKKITPKMYYWRFLISFSSCGQLMVIFLEWLVQKSREEKMQKCREEPNPLKKNNCDTFLELQRMEESCEKIIIGNNSKQMYWLSKFPYQMNCWIVSLYTNSLIGRDEFIVSQAS